jgi:beta-phosphoglucomutase-like phosphatase (HAD superfamily)
MPERARREDHERILAEALARAHAAAPRGVVVFDLDSTLLDNKPRQARILRDYGHAAGVPALQAARPEHWQGWSLERALRNAGLDAAEAARHVRPARRFWAERFFTSAYCRLDVPLAGAPAFVRAIAAAGARIAYVTGRPARMEEGTLAVFRRFGFPLPDPARVHLLMKPRADLGDESWKKLARFEVERLGPVVAAFDNEPAHVNGYAEAWPDALTVHLDTDHSERPVAVLARIPSVASFATDGAAWADDVCASAP